MMKRDLILILLVLTFFPISGLAENLGQRFVRERGSFFHLLHPVRSDIQAEYRLERGISVDGMEQEYDLDFYSFKFELPKVVSSPRVFLRLGFDYQLRNYTFDTASPAPGEFDFDSLEFLHRGLFTAGAGYFFTDNFLLTGRVQPGLLSNLDSGLESEYFDLQGDTYFVWRVNPAAQLLAGIRLSNDFSSGSFYPLLGLRLLSADGRMHLSITAPLEAQVAYDVAESLRVYAKAWMFGEEFHLSNSELAFDTARVEEVRAGIGVEWWIAGYVSLGIEAGLLIDDRFELKVDSGSDVENGGSADTGAYGSVKIGVAL